MFKTQIATWLSFFIQGVTKLFAYLVNQIGFLCVFSKLFFFSAIYAKCIFLTFQAHLLEHLVAGQHPQNEKSALNYRAPTAGLALG